MFITNFRRKIHSVVGKRISVLFLISKFLRRMLQVFGRVNFFLIYRSLINIFILINDD